MGPVRVAGDYIRPIANQAGHSSREYQSLVESRVPGCRPQKLRAHQVRRPAKDASFFEDGLRHQRMDTLRSINDLRDHQIHDRT